MLACVAPRAQPASASLADALGRDSELELHFRTYYFDRLNPGDVTNAAWAIGGWAGYRTGWIGDALRFGVIGYTSQPLWAPLDKQGSLLLAPPQDGYSTISVAYASLKLADQVLTGGRFMVNQPEINPQDNRMTPVTYSGGNLAGSLAGLDYYAAYLNAIKPRNSEDLINFAVAANIADSASEPPVSCRCCGRTAKGSALEVLQLLRAQRAELELRRCGLGGTASRGLQVAPGRAGDGAEGRRRAVAHRDVLFPLVGRAQGRLDDWRHDLVDGWDAVDAATGVAQPNWTEYDLTLDHRFKCQTLARVGTALLGAWPRGLCDQGADGSIHDYRIIVNYEWTF